MRNNIKEKLQNILNKDTVEETDVIYILSRIRKLLEIDQNKKDFKVLNFYCNWALHAQIDDVDAVSKTLEDPGRNVVELMHLFSQFHEELEIFLKTHDLTTKIFSNKETLIKFNHILSEIYSDTPLIIKTTTKKKITFTKGESFGTNSCFFSTTYEDI